MATAIFVDGSERIVDGTEDEVFSASQVIVGGHVEFVRLPLGIVLAVNEEGRVRDLAPNAFANEIVLLVLAIMIRDRLIRLDAADELARAVLPLVGDVVIGDASEFGHDDEENSLGVSIVDDALALVRSDEDGEEVGQ